MNPQAPSSALTTGNSGNLSRFGGGESMGSGGFSGLSGFLGQSRTIASQRRDLVSSSMYNSAMGAATIRAVANGSSSSASSVLANQNQPVTYFIWMRLAFPSDSDNLCKGSPLWFNCTEDDLAGMKPLGLTITSLNYTLEKSARDNAASAAAFQMPSDDEDDDDNGEERRMKRLRSDLPSFDGFDQEVIDRRTNVKQLDMLYVPNYNPDAPRELNGSDETVFTRKFYYGGFVQHIEGKLIRGEKVMTVAVARHMELPNCWGHVNEGSVLAYMAKWVTRPIYSSFLDQNGIVVGPATTTPFIQIRPYKCERRMPRHCSGEAPRCDPTEDDLDSITRRRVRQRVHKYDPKTRLMTETIDASAAPFELSYDAYNYGIFFPVGTVTKVRGAPTESAITIGMRSPTAFIKLQGSCRLDVLLAHV